MHFLFLNALQLQEDFIMLIHPRHLVIHTTRAAHLGLQCEKHIHVKQWLIGYRLWCSVPPKYWIKFACACLNPKQNKSLAKWYDTKTFTSSDDESKTLKQGYQLTPKVVQGQALEESFYSTSANEG